MQLEETRGANTSVQPFSSASLSTPFLPSYSAGVSRSAGSNDLECFLSDVSFMTSGATFRSSSVPNSLSQSDKSSKKQTPNLEENAQTNVKERDSTPAFPDLISKFQPHNLLKSSSKSSTPSSIFPYQFPKHDSISTSTLPPPTPPLSTKGLYPRLSEAHLTYLLASSRGPQTNSTTQRDPHSLLEQADQTAADPSKVFGKYPFNFLPFPRPSGLPGFNVNPLDTSQTSTALMAASRIDLTSGKISPKSSGTSAPCFNMAAPFPMYPSALYPNISSDTNPFIPKIEIIDEKSLKKLSIPNESDTTSLFLSSLVPRSNSLETRRSAGSETVSRWKRSRSHSDIHKESPRKAARLDADFDSSSSSKPRVPRGRKSSPCAALHGFDDPILSVDMNILDTLVSVPAEIKESETYHKYQVWALQNYGDSGKTKTVTANKYRRIVRILTGQELFTADNSKFRFWVKAKGFQLSPKTPSSDGGEEDRYLLVPSKHGAEDGGKERCRPFKRVAVVENFFDIIYSIHVEMDGRGGKHAGQKRTYRAIAEMYSFLPREAVTRFLMSCADCQKRMHLSLESNNNNNNENENSNEGRKAEKSAKSKSRESSLLSDTPGIDFNVPITQTYLNHFRSGVNSISYDGNEGDEESVSSDTDMSREGSPVSSPRPSGDSPVVNGDVEKTTIDVLTDSAQEEPQDMTSAKTSSPQPMETENRSTESPLEEVPSRKNSPALTKLSESKGHPERKRRASSESGDSAMTKTSEGKDDDDDDDNEDDEKMSVGHDIDPERLKAFNMFVRLFVDENLDRMVPISKQPKDKIQAILEACDRQFPEFHERSRKRIRTYLKSCRRMRKSKDQNGWEPLRPTPPHLTSAAAESILATACENESQNAKRMRLGLEPLPASAMVAQSIIVTSNTPASNQAGSQQAQTPVTHSSSQSNNNNSSSSNNNNNNNSTSNNNNSLPSPRSVNCSVPAATDFLRHQPPPPPAFRSAPDFTPSFFSNGHGAALFRPGFPSYQHPAHHHPTVLPHAPITPNATTNGDFGPTDLSMKKSSKGQLSASEVTAIKQLIAGYRESAAFLYRSADELEQLLLQQN